MMQPLLLTNMTPDFNHIQTSERGKERKENIHVLHPSYDPYIMATMDAPSIHLVNHDLVHSQSTNVVKDGRLAA